MADSTRLKEPGLTGTLEYLISSSDPAAIDVLLIGLKTESVKIRDQVVRALLRKPFPRAHIELVRRLGDFSPEIKMAIANELHVFKDTLRHCLLDGDPDLRFHAIELTDWLGDVEQVPQLIFCLNDPQPLIQEKLRDTLSELGGRLNWTQEQFHSVYPHTVSLPQLRDQSLTALSAAAESVPLNRANPVLEMILEIAPMDHEVFRKVIRQPNHRLRELVGPLLRTSTRPAVMQRALDLLELASPPPEAGEAFQFRTDPEFVGHVLQNWPKKLSINLQENLFKMTNIAWLHPGSWSIELVNPSLHEKLIPVMRSLSLPSVQKVAIIEWILRFGSYEAREKANEVLNDLPDQQIQDLVTDGLQSTDVDMQAWATKQLRHRHMPQTFPVLVEKLDSQFPEVRAAAREQLSDFTLKKVLERFETFDAGTGRSVGELLKKIDPNLIEDLQREIQNPIRSKRMRAARCALALGLQEEVFQQILILAADEEMACRRTAIDILSRITTKASIDALDNLRNDSSPRIRQEAERAWMKCLLAAKNHSTSA